MTRKQIGMYWGCWKDVQDACKERGVPVPDRHDLHLQALGRDVSSREFSQKQFDAVLAKFAKYSDPGNVDRQLRQIRQPATRQNGRLAELRQCIALYVADADAYIGGIALDKFGSPDPEDLSDQRPEPDRPSQLEQLIMTLSARLNGATGLRNQAGHSLHDMRLAAGLPCRCKRCLEGSKLDQSAADSAQVVVVEKGVC